ncbi:general transcription factor 3C polypeptide 5 [Nilaparvata lugens]|uniref:general transcription factor 3C polypeptide 5 n=1 Tax=Nilaparvata lugens TaxID=108931 RepID=UPI00193D1EA9|nr:general transcription factor 3C polypeptide 5 [Nilaparvata lugens]XP_022191450.2 general transcription factor 3C polypeptide 5 [Nilaparvata lugens]XP_022191451.2 general transcription factor 3C polypeptide 5 [Nilaparvata lugens]XP_039279403.1 general transcription factor 3C polypeptide 5 [Nilaparvata lugens]
MASKTPPTLYTCISYPGIVKNEDKVLETLGGIEAITQAMTTRNRRLELRFRPEDIYARPTYGDRQSTISFLLKVKVKRKKDTTTSSSMLKENKEVICEPSFIGRVETIFRFSNLCDFQYLPVARNKDGAMENIYHDLMPKDFPTSEWFQLPMSHFLPPAIYSRMDSIQSYLYRQEKLDCDGTEAQANIIGRTRRRRSGFAIFVTFDVPSVPCKPRPSSLKLLEVKFLAKDHYEIIKQCFERRPIWSKTALVYETKYRNDEIKYLLPSVAYHFVSGPFRVMWVRIGYDPRKDPSSRIYQTLDYRIPSKGGISRKIKAKRKADTLQRLQPTSVNSNPRTLNMTEDTSDRGRGKVQINENTCIFRRGLNPPSRQMFYQYCDVDVPEVKEMFARLPKLGPDAQCDRHRGWLPPGFLERCREIISNIIVAQLANEEEDKAETDLKQVHGTKMDDENEEYDDDDDDDDDDEDDEDDFAEEAYDNDYDDNTVLSDNAFDDL